VNSLCACFGPWYVNSVNRSAGQGRFLGCQQRCGTARGPVCREEVEGDAFE